MDKIVQLIRNKMKEKITQQDKLYKKLKQVISTKYMKHNPPYQNQKINNLMGDTQQLKKSYDRAKRGQLISPPFSNDCILNFEESDQIFLDKVKMYDFWDYANEVILKRNKLNINIGNPEQRLSYSDYIMNPLTQLPKAMQVLAFKLFRTIIKICYDRSQKTIPFYKIRKMIEILMNNPSELKDECFLYLIKQTRHNPNIAPNYNEYKLLAILISFLYPSEYFIYGFLNYFHNLYFTETNEEIKQWCLFIYNRTTRTLKSSERAVLPQMNEIRNIEQRRKNIVEVFYENGSREVFFTESHSTIKDLKLLILEKYNIDTGLINYFSILEYSEKIDTIEESNMDDKVKIQDVISSWFNEAEYLQKVMKEKKTKVQFRLVFRQQFRINEENETFFFLEYFNLRRKFQLNRLKLKKRDFIQLLALMIKIDFGEPNEEIENYIQFNFKQISPLINKKNMGDSQMNKFIKEVHSQYIRIDQNIMSCIEEFVKLAKKEALSNCQFFSVTLLLEDSVKQEPPFSLQKKMILGINEHKIYFLSQNFDILNEFEYSQLMKWGFNIRVMIFFIECENQEHPVKITLKTKVGNQIAFFLNTIVDIKLGTPPQENTLMINENVTREMLSNKFFKKVSKFKHTEMNFL